MVNLNTATDITDEELSDVMDYHQWTPDQVRKGQDVRHYIGEAMKVIIRTVPPCPDRSTALRKIREARMDCNSAITHGGKF